MPEQQAPVVAHAGPAVVPSPALPALPVVPPGGAAVPPADAEAEVQAAGGRLSALLRIDERGAGGPGVCSWRLVTFDHLTARQRAGVAWHLADEIMKARAGVTGKYAMWREATLTAVDLDERGKQKLVPFVEPVFGTPTSVKPKSDVHVRGYVSEWLWYLLTRERHEPHRVPVHLEPPKFQVTDGGGDGLVVYEVSGPELVFRLWEIKKHEAVTSTATDVVRGAATQLKRDGARYLAQLSGPFAAAGFPELARDLSDLWIDNDRRAGAGVAVTSSVTKVPPGPFDPMPDKLPDLIQPGQLEGLLCVVDDYATLATMVQRYVWTPL